MQAFIPYIQKVATGPRGSKDLSREEAREAMRLLLSEELHPVQFGAFCMALRVKGEAAEELVGATLALQEVCPADIWPEGPIVTVAPPFDGKDRLVPIAPGAVLLAAQLGAKVLVLSDREVPPKKAVTPSLVFEALGFALPSSFVEAAEQIAERGWSCLEIGRAIPAFERFKQWRNLLGKRPFLATVEKLINPPRGPLLTGVFHGPVLRDMDTVLRGLDYPLSLVVQGTQGSTDFKVKAPTKACLVRAGEAENTFLVDPAAFGLLAEEEPTLTDHSPATCAEWTRRVLAGGEPGGKGAVVLEAGAILFLAGLAGTLEEGVQSALAGWGKATEIV